MFGIRTVDLESCRTIPVAIQYCHWESRTKISRIGTRSLLSRVEIVETCHGGLEFDPEIQSSTHQTFSIINGIHACIADRVQILFVGPETLRDLVNEMLDATRSPDKVVVFEG